MMTPFDYKYQNLKGFACLPAEKKNVKYEKKENWILVVVVKWRYCENCLFLLAKYLTAFAVLKI